MKLFEKLDELVEKGYLRKVEDGDLVLYNYTDACVYDQYWNKYTRNARGTVYNKHTGKIVAKAFPKFFNFEELPVSKSRNLAKQTDFNVYEKADGSLGILYFYGGEWRINTRGSFNSDQALKAREILKKYRMDEVPTDVTFMVEIIYPENKIIVDYGNREELILLSGFDLEHGGMELSDDTLEMYTRHTDMPIIKKYNFKNIDELITHKNSLPSQEEGFVVKFKNGERVKFKSPEYLKVARILSNCTPLTFWKSMKEGKVDPDLVQSVPEEFRDQVEPVKEALETQYLMIKDMIKNEYEGVFCDIIDEGPYLDPADFAKRLGLKIQDKSVKLRHRGALFSHYRKNSRAIDKYVMKYIRPDGNVLKSDSLLK